MNLTHIRYFLAVVDSGNFSKAAARVHVTQPTLSAGIKGLEEELGVLLLLRDSRRVALTDEGQKFLPYARAAFRSLEEGRHALANHDVPTTLRLGILNTAPVGPIARLIRGYRELHPGIVVELFDGTDTKLREVLATGDVEVVITTLRATDSGKSSTPLFEEKVVLATRMGHPLAAKKSVRLADLHGQPYIDRVGCELWPDLQKALARQAVVPRVVYRAAADEVVMELVAGGVGLSVVPRRVRAQENVLFLTIDDFSVTRKIGMKWRARYPSVAVHDFRRFTASHAW